MTLSLRTLIAVTTLLLGTTIAPAVAAEPPAPASTWKSLQQRVAEGEPGARQRLQVETMFLFALQFREDYFRHTGRYPESLLEAIEAGFLPFVPTRAKPDAPRLQDLAQEPQLQPGVLGVRFRPSDVRFAMLGADGDLLAPVIRDLEHREVVCPWPRHYPYHQRLAGQLRDATLTLLTDSVSIARRLPESPADLEQLTGFIPHGGAWRDEIEPGDIGVRIEIDRSQQWLRVTAEPMPPGVAPRLFRFDSDKRFLRCEAMLELEPANWEPWACFVWIQPLPRYLTEWQSPPVPEVIAERQRMSAPKDSRFGIRYMIEELGFLKMWLFRDGNRNLTADELLHCRVGLHRPVTRAGADIPVRLETVSPLYAPPRDVESMSQLWNRLAEVGPSWPAGILLENTPQEIYGLLHDPDATQREARYAPHEVKPLLLRSSGQQWFEPTRGAPAPLQAPEAALLAELHQWHQSNDEVPAIERYLFERLARTSAGFDYLLLKMYARSLLELVEQIVGAENPARLPAWPEMLQALGLAPREYVVLEPSEVAPDGWALLQLEYSASPRIARCAAQHPNGMKVWLSWDMDSCFASKSIYSGGLAYDAHPEMDSLVWQPVVRLAQPIPLPPAGEATP